MEGRGKIDGIETEQRETRDGMEREKEEGLGQGVGKERQARVKETGREINSRWNGEGTNK